jgi:hypothetical protein
MHRQRMFLLAVAVGLTVVVGRTYAGGADPFLATSANECSSGRTAANETPLTEPERTALRQGDYRKAAAVKGHVTDVRMAPDGVVIDLASLASQSTGVVVGTTVACHAYTAGTSVFTDYSIKLTSTLKGDTRPGSTIVVTFLGGRVDFDDGTWAELLLSGFSAPQLNRRYLVFVRDESPSVEHSTFGGEHKVRPTSVTYATFELTTGGVVEPLFKKPLGVAESFRGQQVDSFTAAVRAAVSGKTE